MRFDRRAKTDPDDDVLNITSMVDVVFILLAFFVLSTQFIEPERDVAVAMRTVAASGAADEDLPESVTIRLHAATGDEGEGVAIVMEQVRLPAGDFGAITARLAEINLPQIPVVLAAEEGVSVAAVAGALDAVLASPMRRVSLAESAPSAGEGVAP